MRKYHKYSVEDFLNDDQFIRWVLYPDEEGDTMLAGLQRRFPDKQEEMREAAVLIKILHPLEPTVPTGRINAVWQKINQQKSKQKLRARQMKKIRTYLGYAAMIIFMIALGGGIFRWRMNNEATSFFTSKDFNLQNTGEIILPDGEIKYFNAKKTVIKHFKDGITVNSDTLKNKKADSRHNKEMIRIILPYGMHSDVYLSDGTHVYLNSGSIFSYPEEFNGKNREVFLSGEAFFEVKKDKKKPFLVYTNNLRIRVTGTRFDVLSYENDGTAQVVLVEGKVSIRKKENLISSMPLYPGERAVLVKKNNKLQKDKVEVQPFISWIKGYLVFRKMPLRDVARKLERYYNTKIKIEKDIEDIRFSGKLDLTNGIADVISYISFASSVNYTYRNNCVTFYKPLPMEK